MRLSMIDKRAWRACRCSASPCPSHLLLYKEPTRPTDALFYDTPYRRRLPPRPALLLQENLLPTRRHLTLNLMPRPPQLLPSSRHRVRVRHDDVKENADTFVNIVTSAWTCLDGRNAC